MNTAAENPVLFDHDSLCELIPHSGSMCLLNKITSWDENSICCEANDIHTATHPLRHRGKFTALAMLELGAQAMAVHGGVLARKESKPVKPGYLAAIRNARFHLTIADATETKPLLIEATRLHGDERGQLYEFSIHQDSKLLLTARATVLSRQIQL